MTNITLFLAFCCTNNKKEEEHEKNKKERRKGKQEENMAHLILIWVLGMSVRTNEALQLHFRSFYPA